jgi:predicted HTH transcriptional regulator
MSNIASSACTQNFYERLFGIGTLSFKLKSNSKTVRLGYIPNPAKMLKSINSLRFSLPAFSPLSATQVSKMISSGESKQVELKSSFLWDYQTSTPNKELNKPVIKCISAFLNSEGGTLIIGVNDEKQILGIEPDLNLVKRHNLDGFENLLNTSFNTFIGAEYTPYIEITFKRIGGKTICLINVRPSLKPVYVKYGDAEEFHIRSGNSTRPLSIREANEYIQNRFKKRRMTVNLPFLPKTT